MDLAELGRFQFETKALGTIEIKGLNSAIVADVDGEFEQIEKAAPYDFALHLISKLGRPVENPSDDLTVNALRGHLTKQEIDTFSDKLISESLFMLAPYDIEKDPEAGDGVGIRLTLAESVSKRKKNETATEHLLRIHLANLALQRVAAREYTEKYKDGLAGALGLSSIPKSAFDGPLDFTKKYKEAIKAAQGVHIPGLDDYTKKLEEAMKAAQGSHIPDLDDYSKFYKEAMKAAQGGHIPDPDDYSRFYKDAMEAAQGDRFLGQGATYDLDGWFRTLEDVDIEGYGISSATEDALRSYQDSAFQFKKMISAHKPSAGLDTSDLEQGQHPELEGELETGLLPVVETNRILSRLEESFGEFGQHVAGAISLLSNVNAVTVNLHKDFVQNSAKTNHQNTRLLRQNKHLLIVAVSSLLLTLAISFFGFIAQRASQRQTQELLKIITTQQKEIERAPIEGEAVQADESAEIAEPTPSPADHGEHAPDEIQPKRPPEPPSIDDSPTPIGDGSETDPVPNL